MVYVRLLQLMMIWWKLFVHCIKSVKNKIINGKRVFIESFSHKYAFWMDWIEREALIDPRGAEKRKQASVASRDRREQIIETILIRYRQWLCPFTSFIHRRAVCGWLYEPLNMSRYQIHIASLLSEISSSWDQIELINFRTSKRFIRELIIL